MRKGLSVLLLGVVLAYGNTAVAREGGNGHHDGHHGTENSNAQGAIGATKGQERSGLRYQDHRGHEAGGNDQNHGEGKHKGHEHTTRDKSDKNNKGKSGEGNKNGKGGKHGSH